MGFCVFLGVVGMAEAGAERVFDARRGGWFWAHDAVYDLYGAALGPYALVVYFYLCRRANENGVSAWRIADIAKSCGRISVRTVQRALIVLQNHEPPLISIEKRVSSGQDSNCYTVLDFRPDSQSPRPDSQSPPLKERTTKEKDNRREGQKKTPTPFSLPDWIDGNTWADFIDHRKNIKAPVSTQAAKLLVDDLAKLREKGQDVKAVIEQTIKSGKWKGFFAVKPDYSENQTPRGKHGTASNRKFDDVFDG